MTHYLENFTDLLPAKPDKDLVIADYLKRAKAVGFESFIIADGRRTQRSIEEKVDYVMNTRLDVRYKDAMSEAGFTEDELKLITDEFDEVDPALIARGRAVIVEQEAIDCAEFHFEDQRRAHQKEIKETSGKDEVIKIVEQLASKPPALAGPATSHAVDELISELHASAPWLRDVSVWVHQALRSEYAAGNPWLNLPPILLVGPPGLGKSTYARKIASLAGTPIRVVDAGASAASFAVAGADSTWSSSQAVIGGAILGHSSGDIVLSRAA